MPINLPSVQAVPIIKESKSSLDRIEKQASREARLQLVKTPSVVRNFFETIPLGYELYAVVKKASEEELLISLHFLNKELEIHVKNAFGLEFKPGQKILLALIDKNPFVLKILPFRDERFKIFSVIKNFFRNPSLFSVNINPSEVGGIIPLLIKNSGIFYERKIVEYLLGREKLEELKKDSKYKLLKLIVDFGFNKEKFQIVPKPLKKSYKLLLSPAEKKVIDIRKINLEKFARIYASFYKLSPKLLKTFWNFIFLTKTNVKRNISFRRRKVKYEKGELGKIFFLTKEDFKPLLKSKLSHSLTYYQIKENFEFINFLQAWTVNNNLNKLIVPFRYEREKFFLGFYKSEGKINLSLLWKNGLIKLTYSPVNKLTVLTIFRSMEILEKYKKSFPSLLKELQNMGFEILDFKVSLASNLEELFILDMAQNTNTNFINTYL
jgi:hypothetical protein